MKNRSWTFVALQAFGLFCISFFSQYELPDYQRMDLSIAAMMTPGGLVHNLWVDSMSSLKVYYFLEPNGNIEFTSARYLVLTILIFGLISLVLMYSYLIKKNSAAEVSNEA